MDRGEAMGKCSVEATLKYGKLGLNRRQGDSIPSSHLVALDIVRYINTQWIYHRNHTIQYILQSYLQPHITTSYILSQWSITPTLVTSTTDLTKRSSKLLERVDSLAITVDLPLWIPISRLVKAASYLFWYSNLHFKKKRDIASKGGHASRGKFEPGSPRAKEAGRKGGRSVHQQPEE